MNTRIAVIALVVLALIGGGIFVLTSGQGKAPVAQATPINATISPIQTPLATTATTKPTFTPIPTTAPSSTPVPTPATFVVSGKLMGSTGSGVGGYRVIIFVAEPKPCSGVASGGINTVKVTESLSADDGTYRLRPVPPGRYLVLVLTRDGRTQLWWQDQNQCENATVITLSSNLTVNFTIR